MFTNITNIITTNGAPVIGQVTNVTGLSSTLFRTTFNVSRTVYPWFTVSSFNTRGAFGNTVPQGMLPNSAVQSAQITAANASIQTISANLGAFQTYANTTFSTVANAATQATAINSINANVTAANAQIQTISANLGAYQTWANGRITTLDANLGTATTNITTLFANAATQAT